VIPTAVSRPAMGRRYGSACGTVARATRCASRYTPRKIPAYASDAVEMTDCLAM
jgi:hypothetical protein